MIHKYTAPTLSVQANLSISVFSLQYQYEPSYVVINENYEADHVQTN